MDNKILIFGHKNPDTDSICSALAYAELKSKTGWNVEPVRLGEVNEETQYALSYFNAEAPRYIEKASQDAEKVILVDHNERQQSADDIDDVQVIEVIDHHRISNFETKDPLYYRAEPVGCTATILYKLFRENDVEISRETAGLMLSAIISDSLLFKSPTCTEEDVKVAEKLAEIAGVDSEKYGLEMLKAGADVSGKSVSQLISIDAKEFSMGESKVEIAQVNTVDVNEVLDRQQELEDEISKVINEKKLDLFLFVVTDILDNDSKVLALGDKAEAVEKSFQVSLENNTALLKGVVSRKKQIVPVLNKQF
ncbi:manganese-dependent inorganic pyrophosphatase [Evansella sp. LMS18]|uniref:manganese-dependent inorganic pyrophosphatase n=1 Tax=Evansella sp. LMS18 TaxID=2924033 RepID=UPI0020CFEACD|nr:manganese-dependent inorganic pyrophosphatase [Evansella sp. LMS18]UTR09158.1 manganese-dependent inorganic pyrophosphatase [Evansella sp. LMS18]